MLFIQKNHCFLLLLRLGINRLTGYFAYLPTVLSELLVVVLIWCLRFISPGTLLFTDITLSFLYRF